MWVYDGSTRELVSHAPVGTSSHNTVHRTSRLVLSVLPTASAAASEQAAR